MAKILIVEDSATQIKSIQKTIEAMGHETVLAVDGEDAVRISKEQKPDLILMDVIMPQMNGFQATRVISRDSETSHIPIVILTTKSNPTDEVWGLRQGAKAYLVKPIDAAKLSETINKFLV